MLSRLSWRNKLAAVVILGLIIRLIFLFSTEQLPVMWDARLYSSAAIGLIHYLSEPGEFGHPELDSLADSVQSRQQFFRMTQKYIRGEQIEWLYYKIPTMKRAQHYLFLSGPTLPLILAAIFALDFGEDFYLVRRFNGVVDSISIVLIMLIAARLFDKRTALLAGLLYCFYPPFIQLTGMVSPEPITILLILLTFNLLMLWHENKQNKYLYLCGLTLGLLVLTKPTGVLLFVPFLLGFVYDQRDEIKPALLCIGRALVPFILVILPWLIIASAYFDTLAIRDPDYSTANLRASSSIEYEGYDLDYSDVDFWVRPVMYTIKNDPLGYGHLLLKKFVRMWAAPHHDFERSFLMPLKLSSVYHFILVLSGLFGIFLFRIKKKKGQIFLLLIPLYYTLTHIIFHSLARYNLNPMPIIIIAAAAILIYSFDYIRSVILPKRQTKILLKISLFIAGVLFIIYFPEKLLINLFGVSAGVIILHIFKILILLMMIYVLFKIIIFSLDKRSAIKVSLAPFLILIVLFLTTGAASDKWAEWHVRLDRSDQKLAVRIYVSDDFRLQPDELVRIGIDMRASRGRKTPFELTTIGEKSLFYIDREPISAFYYRKGTYNVYESLLDIDRVQMRSWAFIPINPASFNRALDKYGYIEMIIGNGENSEGYIDVYGNYPILGKQHTQLPSLSHYSIERFVEKGDPRIWTDYNLSSDSVISYYIDDTKETGLDKNDLSPEPGLQLGRYRMFIEVKRFNKTFYYF